MGAYLDCHPRVVPGSFYGNGESFVFHWISTPSATSSSENILTEEDAASTPKASGALSFKVSMKLNFCILY